MKKNLYKAALLAALGLGGVAAAQAQINSDDLVLGFTSPNATAMGGNKYDYIIDLGNLSTIEAGGASQLSLSGSQFDSATFNSILGSAVTGGSAYVGIVGAQSGSSGNVFLSAASQPPQNTYSDLGVAAGYPTGLSLGQVSQTATGSYFNLISTAPGSQGAAINNFSLYEQSPLTAISASQGSGSQTIDLTLWQASYNTFSSSATPFSDIGFISLNLSGGNLGAAWDQEALAVPEPATLAIMGGAGLVLLGLRRSFNGKTA